MQETALRLWIVAANILISSREQPMRSCLPTWGMGEGLTALHHRKPVSYKILHRDSEVVASCSENGNEISGSMKGLGIS
jgi:hypothetical protein